MSIALNYITKGSGDPIICLHGFSEDVSTWQTLYEQVKKNCHAYALYCIDLMGHGKSPRPQELECYAMDYLVEKIHDTVQAALHNTQYKQYSLLGYSLGGRVAMHYALKYAHELRAIILESSSLGIEDAAQKQERKKQDEKLANIIEQNSIEFFEQYWSQLELFKSQQSLSTKVKLEIKSRRLQNTPQCLANTLRMLGQGNLPYIAEDFFKLNLPKLYICGALDEKYLSVAKDLAPQDIIVKTISRAGHNVHLEQPEIYYELVHNFLKSHYLGSKS